MVSLPMSKKDTPTRDASKKSPIVAKARPSAVVAKARQSAVVCAFVCEWVHDCA